MKLKVAYARRAQRTVRGLCWSGVCTVDALAFDRGTHEWGYGRLGIRICRGART